MSLLDVSPDVLSDAPSVPQPVDEDAPTGLMSLGHLSTTAIARATGSAGWPSGSAPMTSPMLATIARAEIAATLPVPLVDGALPGVLVEGIFEVLPAQLQPAPGCPLFLDYDPATDPQVRRWADLLTQGRVQPPVFLALPTGATVEVDGAYLPAFSIYSDIAVLFGMRLAHSERLLARIRIPVVRDEGELLLTILGQRELAPKFTQLQRCDLVNVLCSSPWSYTEVQVAQALASNDETHGKPDHSTVHRMRVAAQQPSVIRGFLGDGSLTLAHVRYLSERLSHDQELRVLCARWVAQERWSANRMVRDLLNRLVPYNGQPTIELRDRGDYVAVLDLTAAPVLAPVRAPAPYLPSSTMLMAASPMRVKQAARRYGEIVVHAHADPRKTAVEADVLATLREWIESQQAIPVPVAALEEQLLGLLSAVHDSLAEEQLLTAEGRLAPVVASTPEARQA